MEIKHKDNGKNGSFYIEQDGMQEAELTYQYIGEHTIDINHTQVMETLKGQGIGHQLIDEAVAFMRKSHLKVDPSCSYAQAVFKKNHEQYQDVLIK